MPTEALVVECVINAPAGKLWQAITDRSQMKDWYFDIANFEAEPGFEFEFYGSKDDTKYLHLCKIISVEPGRKLSYNWKYRGYPGESLVTFELFDEGEQTRVKLSHEGLDTFGTHNPDLAKENFRQGWEHIIGKSLRNFVEQGPLSSTS